MIEKIELGKQRYDASLLNNGDGGASSASNAEVLKLKTALKKLEEQREFLFIEKEQLDYEIRCRTAETEDLKVSLKSSSLSFKRLQDAYRASLIQLSGLNAKLNRVASNFEATESLSSMKSRFEGIVQENEKVKFNYQAPKRSQNFDDPKIFAECFCRSN